MRPGRFLTPFLASGGLRRPVLPGDGRRPCASAFSAHDGPNSVFDNNCIMLWTDRYILIDSSIFVYSWEIGIVALVLKIWMN
jgi:hypothetical protein